jgi:replication factor A1
MEAGPPVPAETRLRDLRARSPPVSIVARIVSAERREVIRRADGGRRPVLSGLLSDGTASVRFTWWDPPSEPIEKGLVLRAAPVEVREFRGALELTFGWRTRAAPANAAELPELTDEERRPRALAGLRERDEGFVALGRIVEVAEKSVTVGTERRAVFEGLLADPTDEIGFTAWTDFRLRPGETVRITGAYVSSFRGLRRLTIDDRARVERVAPELVPPTTRAREPISLARLGTGPGAERALIVGRIVGLQPVSGLVARCPHCRRRTDGGACRVHGAVTTEPDLVARAVVDDGSGTFTANLDRAVVERLTGKDLAAYRQLLSDRADPSAVEADIAEALFGRRFEFDGAIRRDEYGLSMDPRVVSESAPAGSGSVAELARRSGGGAPT